MVIRPSASTKVIARVSGIRRVDLVDDARGHEQRQALAVEAARRLDLAHLLRRRHVDAGDLLDLLDVLRRGLEHIGPDQAVGQRLAGDSRSRRRCGRRDGNRASASLTASPASPSATGRPARMSLGRPGGGWVIRHLPAPFSRRLNSRLIRLLRLPGPRLSRFSASASPSTSAASVAPPRTARNRDRSVVTAEGEQRAPLRAAPRPHNRRYSSASAAAAAGRPHAASLVEVDQSGDDLVAESLWMAPSEASL